jgi:hypothetical protein
MVADPLPDPGQLSDVVVGKTVERGVPAVTIEFAVVTVHPVGSNMVTVYVPGCKLVNTPADADDTVCGGPELFNVYKNKSVFPGVKLVGVTVIDPLFTPGQLQAVTTGVGAATALDAPTLMVIVFVQPVTSVAVTEWFPPDKLLNVYWSGEVDTVWGAPPSIENVQEVELVAAVTVADPMFCPHVVFTIEEVNGSRGILFT